MNLQHGIDLVKVSRFEKLLAKYGDRLLFKLFSEKEINDGMNRYSQNQFYAVRYAAKEAFVKALGTGFQHGIRLKDIEVESTEGIPRLRLYGKAESLFDSSFSSSQLSLTHDGDYCAASVILYGE